MIEQKDRNPFGSSIVLTAAEGDDKTVSKDSGKDEGVKGSMKTIEPIEKVRVLLNKALEALDGTAFEPLRQTISACIEACLTTEEEVVTKTLELLRSQRTQAPQAAPVAPTPGQIAGTEAPPAAAPAPAATQPIAAAANSLRL